MHIHRLQHHHVSRRDSGIRMEMLRQNCIRADPRATCAAGNVASIASTVLWFAVLLPQLLRNQSQRSVAGLNPLWALTNFTASLCNVLFVFSIPLPLQVKVMAVYMPTVELLILVQFWWWYDWDSAAVTCTRCTKVVSTSSWEEGAPVARRAGLSRGAHALRVAVTLACGLCWTTTLSVQAMYPSSKAYYAWAAIALWSVESFPQLWTNISDPQASVCGQSAISVAITCVGKTTDALAAFLLNMPHQTHVVTYFSSTTAWVNALHVFVLYPGHSLTASVTSSVTGTDTGTATATATASGAAAAETVGEPFAEEALLHPGHVEREVSHERRELVVVPFRSDEEAAKAHPRAACVCCRRCMAMSSCVEEELRVALRRSCCLRASLGAVLSSLVVLVFCGAVWRIWEWWALLMPASTLGFVCSFHLALLITRRRPF